MKRAFLLLSFLIFPALALGAAPAKLKVSDAWVRESIPGSRITAAYLTVTNLSGKTVNITGASSPAAKWVEMHEMATIEGVMSMRQTKTIAVPGHGKAKLEEGGMHLMLIDLPTPLRAGTTVDLTLELSDGSSILIKAPVKSAQ